MSGKGSDEMAIRDEIKFNVPCTVVLQKDPVKKVLEFKKILLDANDWGDWALQSMPDLTAEEIEMIEAGKGGIWEHRKLDWDWM